MLGDKCAACESLRLQRVDLVETIGYTSDFNNGKLRSNTMNRSERIVDVAFESDEDMDNDYTVVNFLVDLEGFLDSKLDDVSRGTVFLSENKNGVTVNLLIGTPFENTDLEINQINVIIAPTDRKFLGSEGVHMGAKETHNENVFFDTREQAREFARNNTNVKFKDNGGRSAHGERWSCQDAFKSARNML